ncbi:MAG: hypothetical protein ACLUAL_00955 [Blautia wexlerae]
MYCIAILTDQEQEGQNCAEYIRNYCTEKKVFPLIEIYQNQEQFLSGYEKQYRQWCSCIARCVWTECGRTSPFPVSEMWDHLV